MRPSNSLNCRTVFRWGIIAMMIFYKTIPNSILTSVKFRHRELGIRALNEVVAGLEAPSSRSRTLVSGVLVERSSVRDLRA